MRTSTKSIEALRGQPYIWCYAFLTVCNLFVFATGYSDLAVMNAYCISNVLNEIHSAKAKIEIKKDLAMPYDFQFFNGYLVYKMFDISFAPLFWPTVFVPIILRLYWPYKVEMELAI